MHRVDAELDPRAFRQLDGRRGVPEHRTAPRLRHRELVLGRERSRAQRHGGVEAEGLQQAGAQERLGPVGLGGLRLGALLVGGVLHQKMQAEGDECRGGVVAREQEGQRLVLQLGPGEAPALLQYNIM